MSSMSAPTSRHRYILLFVILLAAGLLWWTFGRTSSGDPAADQLVAQSDGKIALNGKEGLHRRGKTSGKIGDADWKRTDSSISGKVTSHEGAPIPRAEVCAWALGEVPSSRRRIPICANAGSDGKYTVSGLPPGKHQVVASSEGYVPGRYTEGRKYHLRLAPGQSKSGIDITLDPGGVEVRGVVKDISGGVIDDAFVSVRGEGFWWNSPDGKVGVRTNADGEFRLWTKEGEVSVSAVADGYAEAERSGAAPGYTFELFLTPESVVVGRVVDAETGAGVPDARVKAEGDGFFWSSGGGVAFTDNDGRFRIDGLSPGRYKPSARTTEGWGQAAQSVHVGLAETSEPVEIRLHPAVTISARIVVAGNDSKPCDQGSLRLKQPKSDRRFWGETDDEGFVEIKGVFPGSYEVEAYCTDYVPREDYDDLEVGEEPIEGLVYEVDAGLAIRGIVVDAEDNPVKRARLWAQEKGGSARGQRTNNWGVHTEADGSFEMAGMLPGTYEIDVMSEKLPGPDPKPEIELSGASDVEGVKIVLQANGTIAGRVEDASGNAVPDVTVRVLSSNWRGKSQKTTDDGSFELEGVQVGEHRIVAQQGWNDRMRAPGTTDDEIQGEEVVVNAGETTEVTLLVEDQSGKIRGRVVDETGGPVVDAFIESTRESDSKASAEGGARTQVRWGGWDDVPVLTDQDGRFELESLATEGKYTVRAFRKGGGEGIVEHVAVGSKGVVVAIRPTGSLSGKVAVGGGGAPDRFTVGVTDQEQGLWRRENFFRTSGAWTVDELPPGKFEITVSAEEGDARQEDVPLEEAEAKTGVDFELVAKVTLKGSVVDAETGEPVAGMSVSARAGRMGIFMNDSGKAKKNVSDEKGRFEVENAPSGEIQITVFPRDWNTSDYQFAWMKRTISPDEKVVELDPIRVVKKRIDEDERPGDLGFKLKENEPGDDWEDEPLIVGFVRPQGPADQAGIAVGDEIEKIGSHDVTGDNKYLYFTLASVKEGTPVQLTLKGGKSATVTAGKPL